MLDPSKIIIATQCSPVEPFKSEVIRLFKSLNLFGGNLAQAKKVGDSDKDLEKLTKKMEEELEPKQKALMELHSQLMGKIRHDINKSIQEVAKSYGIDVVLNKEIVIQGPMGPVGKEEVVLYGGFNMTNFVIETLNK